jgi:hypothetical protein
MAMKEKVDVEDVAVQRLLRAADVEPEPPAGLHIMRRALVVCAACINQFPRRRFLKGLKPFQDGTAPH